MCKLLAHARPRAARHHFLRPALRPDGYLTTSTTPPARERFGDLGVSDPQLDESKVQRVARDVWESSLVGIGGGKCPKN